MCIGADDKIPPELPLHMPHREAFRKEGMTLYPDLGMGKFTNQNSRADVERILRSVHEQLQYVKGAPSVQMKHIPPDVGMWREEVEDEWQERRVEREERLDERDGAGGALAMRIAKRRMELERRDVGGGLRAGAEVGAV